MNKRIITIGIPARNEEVVIEQAINRLLEQRLPHQIQPEIIVCANACKDKTAEIVKRISRKDSRVKLIETTAPGKPHAMNLIKAEAHIKSDLLFFCDADTVVEPTAIGKLVNALDSNPHISAVTVVPLFYEGEKPRWTEDLAALIAKLGSWRSIAGQFFGIRKEHLPTFPTDLISEDVWLARELKRLGRKYALVLGVNAPMLAPKLLKDYARQRIRWRTGLLQIEQMDLKPAKPEVLGGNLTPRLQRLKKLPLRQKLLVIPALTIHYYSYPLAKRALKKGEFKAGWESPLRPRKIK